jgi:hypothetical protein
MHLKIMSRENNKIEEKVYEEHEMCNVTSVPLSFGHGMKCFVTF